MDSIGILVTVWKREYLDEQLTALIGQSLQPSVVTILQNERHIDIRPVVDRHLKNFSEIKVISSEHNLKFFGRFSLASVLETDYILLIDDDVIPGKEWLSICLRKSIEYSAIICPTGRIIIKDNFRPEVIDPALMPLYFIGDNYDDNEYNRCAHDTRVDYGCNSYFFRREWLSAFWKIWPRTFLSGEDMHLSGSLMINEGISTIVPGQQTTEQSGNLKKLYSCDDLSSWRASDFFDIRQSVLEYLIKDHGWRPLLW